MKIPVLLVTGFLGSGKTTFLKQLAESHPDWRLVFLVNEFAQTSVDGDTLAAAGTPTQSVVGGSLFCNCKAAEFVNVMRGTVLQQHQQTPLDAVVIETSGIADPEAIGKIMSYFELNDQFDIYSILSITTPKSLLKLADHLPNINAQLRCSDLIVINKVDLASAEEVQSAEEKIHRVNPNAQIIHSERCAFEFELQSRIKALPNEDISNYTANPYSTETITLDSPLTRQQLDIWLHTLPDEILRVKGHIMTDSGWLRVEKSYDGLDISDLLVKRPEPNHVINLSSLVIIAHDDHVELLSMCRDALLTLATPSQPATSRLV